MAAAASAIPPLPPGFKLDDDKTATDTSTPPLPPGFKLDPAPQQKTPTSKEAMDFFNQSKGHEGLYALKAVGNLLLSPVTSLAKIPGELYDFAKRGFKNDTSQGMQSSFVKDNPFSEAYGDALMAVAPAAAGDAAGKAAGAVRESLGVLKERAPSLNWSGAARELPYGVGGFVKFFQKLTNGKSPREIGQMLYEQKNGRPPKGLEIIEADQMYKQFVEKVKARLKSEEPEAPEPPKAPTPLKVKPSIKSRLGTGAPAQEQYSAPSGRPVRQGVNRALAPPEAGTDAETATGVQPTTTAAASAAGTTGPVKPTATARYSEAEGNPSKLTSRELNPGKVINAQANAKNLRMAARFKRLGMTPDQVQSMTESEYLQHLREENAAAPPGSPRMDPPRPGPLRRSFVELKNDIVHAMR